MRKPSPSSFRHFSLALLVFSGALSFAISPRPSFARNSASSQAQSSDDPNRPPYAQTPRRAPQHVQAASMPQPSAPQPSAPQPSTNAPSGDERILFDHVNESRVLAGLHPLQWDANLAAAARRHCLLLVQHEALSHQFPGEADLKIRLRQNGVEFSVAAENVAVAGTPDELHYAWMHSPPHRANILDPDLNAIGIAELPGSKGLYATQDFAQALESLSLAEQEQQIRSLLSAAGLRTADNAERTQWSDARRTCQMPSGYAGKPAAFVKFDSADLRQLPAKLRTLLAGGKYRSAAVGACDPIGSSDGFSQYRLAVLLYP